MTYCIYYICKVISKHSDPNWLRFINADNSAHIDELRISWVNVFGQIAELEVAFSGNEPAQEKIDAYSSSYDAVCYQSLLID